MHISYLSEALALQIFEIAINNSYLAFGLGQGCGIMFPYLSQITKDQLSSQVNINGFAFGFGIGIGKIRRYLESSILRKQLRSLKASIL